MSFVARLRIDLRLLVLLPPLTYTISYLYLAHYHGTFFILNTIMHGGGTYTLLQTMFYASHFLGHIPIHTMLALFFVGAYSCFSGLNSEAYPKRRFLTLLILLLLLLGSSFFLGLAVFGYEDTFAFVAQQKQRMGIYGEGGAGSWEFHTFSHRTISSISLTRSTSHCYL